MDEVLESIREQGLAMLSKHASMWDRRLGQIDSVSHRVKTTGGPIFQQPYRAGPFVRTAEQTEVNRMLAEDFIEPATSEWSSPVVSVPKRDGGMRFCVDYRKLNNPRSVMSTHYRGWTNALIALVMQLYSRRWMRTLATGKSLCIVTTVIRLHSRVMSAPSVSNVCRLGYVTHRQPSNVLWMSPYVQYAGTSVCDTSMTSLSSRRQWKFKSKIWTRC
jgi:hypothetical protein